MHGRCMRASPPWPGHAVPRSQTLADARGETASARSIHVFDAEPGVIAVPPTAAAQPGMFEGKVRRTMTGMKTLTATADGLVLQLGVTFTAGAWMPSPQRRPQRRNLACGPMGTAFSRWAPSWLTPGKSCRRTKPIVRFRQPHYHCYDWARDRPDGPSGRGGRPAWVQAHHLPHLCIVEFSMVRRHSNESYSTYNLRAVYPKQGLCTSSWASRKIPSRTP